MSVDEALALCDELLGKIEDLPSRAADFAESVEEKIKSIREWIEEHDDVTDNQVRALENMGAGIDRWQR